MEKIRHPNGKKALYAHSGTETNNDEKKHAGPHESIACGIQLAGPWLPKPRTQKVRR
jgi:hypothetical protein